MTSHSSRHELPLRHYYPPPGHIEEVETGDENGTGEGGVRRITASDRGGCVYGRRRVRSSRRYQM